MGAEKSIDCIGSHEPSAFGGAASRRAQLPTFTKRILWRCIMKKKKFRRPRIRVPLPQQTGGAHKSGKDYNCKREKIKLRKELRGPND